MAEGVFPATRYSVLAAVASADAAERERAFGLLVEGYWKPVYKLLRVKWRWGNEEAEDATQEFFARAFEKGFFSGYDPSSARFRTFLRTCLDRFAANRHRDQQREKRGGGRATLSLDFLAAEGELGASEADSGLDAEQYFQREWMRSFFEQVVAELGSRCRELGKATQLALFERYDLADGDPGERPTYAALAAETGLPVTQVTNYLAWARREFRRLALERLRRVTTSDEELRAEAKLLFGVEPP